VRLGEIPQPLFFEKADGPYVWDIDGNRYVDYVLGQGPMLLGHRPVEVVDAVRAQLDVGLLYGGQHRAEVEVAELLIDMLPWAQAARFSTTGTEAVQTALRLARAATGRSKILKFEGHYHGWQDCVLVNLKGANNPEGPAEIIPTRVESLGVTDAAVQDTIVIKWNDSEAIERLMSHYGSELAAVIMEPVMANSGVILPQDGYLQKVRSMCDKYGAVLIFDEVITGFRIALRGAEEIFGVCPDLAVYGKALASGFPIGCVAGRSTLFDGVDAQRVTLAGTFNANPVSMAAAKATLKKLTSKHDTVYETLNQSGSRLVAGISSLLADVLEDALVEGLPSVFCFAFGRRGPRLDHRDVVNSDAEVLKTFIGILHRQGVRVTSRGTLFLSASHDSLAVDLTLERVAAAVAELARAT
jgi:glutamate-1-semialdehyde 2,1-aminomutase